MKLVFYSNLVNMFWTPKICICTGGRTTDVKKERVVLNKQYSFQTSGQFTFSMGME